MPSVSTCSPQLAFPNLIASSHSSPECLSLLVGGLLPGELLRRLVVDVQVHRDLLAVE